MFSRPQYMQVAMASDDQPPQPSQNDQAIFAGLLGTNAAYYRSIRRRLYRKEKNALAAGGWGSALQSTSALVNRSSSTGSVQGAEYRGNGIRSQVQAESHDAIESQKEQDQQENRQQARSRDQGIAQLDDSPNSNGTSGLPSPQHEDKLAFSTPWTSAKIVDMLLPDCPAPASYPRRMTSMCCSYERKRASMAFTQAEDPRSQECEFHETGARQHHPRYRGLLDQS
jgi:hypothetical protein